MRINNILKEIPDSFPEEIVEILHTDNSFRIERILSRGHHSPEGFWYDQEEDEWVLLIQGSAVLNLLEPEETIRLEAGDTLLIPAHRKHRVESTNRDTTSVWLTVFIRKDTK